MEKYRNIIKDARIFISNGKLSINGTVYSYNTFKHSFFELSDRNHSEFTELMLLERSSKSAFNDVVKGIYENLMEEFKPSRDILKGSPLKIENNLEELTPVVNMEEDEVFLIDETGGVVSEIKYHSWLKAIDPDFRKALSHEAMPIAKFFFDPYTSQKIIRGNVDSGTREMVYINTYNPPNWRLDATPSETCPKVLEEFLDHLLMGNKEQIAYCLRWMAEALVGRNETYLVLNGDKGVGKNTLYEIMKAVVGARYAVTAPQSLTTSHFNSVLNNKRLILLDEYKINRVAHLFLKKIANKYQTIEKKGHDADKEIETFNSFMIFHNDISDMYLEKDDRRFSVLDITKKNLLELWTADKIDGLMAELNNPNSQAVKDIGEYLLHVATWSFNNSTPFKGDKFHDIVEYNMPTWLQIVVAMIENGEVKEGRISFKKEIEKKLASEMMGTKKIQWRKATLEKLLREYRYKDKYEVGTIEGGTKAGLELIVNQDILDLFDYEIEETDIFGFNEEDL